MRLLAPVTWLQDVPFVLAGHGYDLPGAPRDEPGGTAAGDGGAGVLPIALVVVLALVTAALLVWLSSPSTKARLVALMPRTMLVVAIALPLIAWPVLTGGDGDDGTDDDELIVQRAKTRTGAPELVVSLANEDLNQPETTGGRSSVRLECFGRDGRLLLGGRHRWPFVDEVGFDAPHAHQRATAAEVRAAARCHLRGTSVPLQAAVEDG